jgi:6-phosphogluconolactonase
MAIPGQLILTDDVPSTFSARMIEAFRSRTLDTFSVALSGGGTARDCYEHLATTSGNQIDWWKVDIYWGDERCVPHDDPDSNYLLAREALLDRVGAANATHLMRCAEGPDPYQLRIGDLGRIDLVHLGLGPDGHTASLFPQSAALEADPGRLVVLNDDPLGTNPHQRMTLTFAGIARARLVVVTVAGESKADPLARIAAGEDLPASRIEADEVVWLVDPAAASKLPDDVIAAAVAG